MNQLLNPRQVVLTESSSLPCIVEQPLGGGGQGEVYRATLNGTTLVALKWYFPAYLQQDTRLRERLNTAIKERAPSDRFLWPLEVVSAQGLPGFGYIMPLREPRFKGFVDLMKCRIDPDFRALATAGFELAHSFLGLHSKGLCYRDISFGNVFFDPTTGEVRICDNDNVDVNGQPGGVNGTPRFMAPEIVRGDDVPTNKTDLFSLAVLLFYMLMVHHPLEGKKEASIHSLDLPAMTKLYGQEPVFIFDPVNDSNRPVKGLQDNALQYWPIYPEYLREMFTRSFTDGIRDPQNGRVRESEWRLAMIRLRDSILYCGSCGAENFYDVEALKKSGGQPGTCWRCHKPITLPFRIRLGRNVIMLNNDTQLFTHHVDDQKQYDFSKPIAQVSQNPNNPSIWGLKNIGTEKWVCILPDATIKEVEPGRSISLVVGTKVNFGKMEGDIR